MGKENTFNQDLDENLICRSLEFFATQKIGMTFLFCLLSGVAHAQCIPAPDCGELGYTETSCDGDSLKCPFDISKLYCIPCDSVYQYSCSNAGEIGKGNSCNGKYIECGCADGYEVDGTGCKLSCASSYQYTCTGANETGGSGTACGGKYKSCTCASDYEWSGSGCDYCGDSYKYACTVSGNITGGRGTACGGKYESCYCALGYGWQDGTCAKYDTSCIVGAIYYSDGSCSNSCVDWNKHYIGVVVKDNELVLSLSVTYNNHWSDDFVDTSLTNYYSDTDAKTDFNGKSNTATIIAEASYAKAAKYCNNYTNIGTSAGDWYLPAAGELYSYVYPNYNAIYTAMTALGGTWKDYRLWSSSEYDNSNAWSVNIYDGTMSYSIKNQGNPGYATCLLAIN